MNLPQWICFGVVKGGTTSLYNALEKHPQIYIPTSKETHFFCSPDYEKGVEYYSETFFKDAKKDVAIGDMSPKYFIHNAVPQRIYDALGPDIKFIVILRDPVERAWSHYCHSYERFHQFSYRPTEDLSFADAIQAEDGRLAEPDEYSFTHHMWNAYKLTGYYAYHLERWMKVFDRKNILVLLLDDLINDTDNTLKKVTDHIGIDPFDEVPTFDQSNSYSREDRDEVTLSAIRAQFLPDIKKLERLIGINIEAWKK